MPIAIMPKFLQTLCYIMPFGLAADLPFRIYSGSIPINDGIIYILMQILWIAVLTITGTLITNSRLKKVVIQGG